MPFFLNWIVSCSVICVIGHAIEFAVLLGAWKELHNVYVDWCDKSDQGGPEVALTYVDDQTGVVLVLPVLWNEQIDPQFMAETKQSPFEMLKKAIPELIPGQDFGKCKLFYRLEDGSMVELKGDRDVAHMVTWPADFNGRQRRVYVECMHMARKTGMYRGGSTQSDTVNIGAIDVDWSTIDESQYQLALNAYRHAKGHQLNTDYARVDKIEEDLQDKMDLASFEIFSDAKQIYGMKIEEYKEQIDSMAQSFGWTDKTKQMALAAVNAKQTAKASKHLAFIQKDWRLEGSWERWATVVHDGLISLTVSTSRFTADVPDSQKDQNAVQWLTNSGTITRKFQRQMEYLMQADGETSATSNLAEPIPAQFSKLSQKSNKRDL